MNMKHLAGILSQIILFVSLFANARVVSKFDAPDLGQKYSQLEDYYNKADQSMCQCSLKPLSRFHEDYASCYWIVKNVKGEYYGDHFVIGLANYTLTNPSAPQPPSDGGPLLPPGPQSPIPGAGEVIVRQGPAVVYGETESDDEVSLDHLGVVEFPTAQHSNDEKALAIALKTNVNTVGPATDTSYLRRYSKDGSVALKEVFTAGLGTATGYGYCWKASPQKPR